MTGRGSRRNRQYHYLCRFWRGPVYVFVQLSAFADMLPCEIEITGVAGSLQVYGCGTAFFLVDDDSGQPFILRINNCLYGQGQFNLLSVSQMCQDPNNSVDFHLESPALIFSSTVRSKKRQIRLPLSLEDGLFALGATPFQLDDPRFSTLRKVNVTPDGVFRPSNNQLDHRWNSKILFRPIRVLVFLWPLSVILLITYSLFAVIFLPLQIFRFLAVNMIPLSRLT